MTLINGPVSGVYLFIHAAKDAATLQRNRTQMLDIENTFRALSAGDKAAAKPWSMRTVAMPRGGFAELARSSPIANPEQQLRLLNGVYAGGDVKPGAPVKTVVQ